MQPRRAPDIQAIFDAIGDSGETGRSRQGPGLKATGPAQSVRQSETARPRQLASLASAPSHGTLASLDANLLDANLLDANLLDANLQAGQQANRARVEEVASLIGNGVCARPDEVRSADPGRAVEESAPSVSIIHQGVCQCDVGRLGEWPPLCQRECECDWRRRWRAQDGPGCVG
jgi:hypothetical protein